MGVAHTRVSLLGTLQCITKDDEIWSNTIAVLDDATGEPVAADKLQGYCDDILQDVAAWFLSADANHSTASYLQSIKCANVDESGHYTAPPAQSFPSAPVAGANSSSVPSFMSIALSWTTDVALGRRGRWGRIYPPNYGAGAQSGAATISSSKATDLMTGAAALLTALVNSDGASGVVGRPGIVSDVGNSFHAITGIRVGNIYDVQRRRKNAVPETYVSEAWAAG